MQSQPQKNTEVQEQIAFSDILAFELKKKKKCKKKCCEKYKRKGKRCGSCPLTGCA